MLNGSNLIEYVDNCLEQPLAIPIIKTMNQSTKTHCSTSLLRFIAKTNRIEPTTAITRLMIHPARSNKR